MTWPHWTARVHGYGENTHTYYNRVRTTTTTTTNHHHHEGSTRLHCTVANFFQSLGGWLPAELAGAVARRRERRLRSWLRHQRTTVRMVLGLVITPPEVSRRRSREGGRPRRVRSPYEDGQDRGERPGVLQDPAPQLLAEHVAGPCSLVPSLAPPSLADATADVIDSSSLRLRWWPEGRRRRGRLRIGKRRRGEGSWVPTPPVGPGPGWHPPVQRGDRGAALALPTVGVFWGKEEEEEEEEEGSEIPFLTLFSWCSRCSHVETWTFFPWPLPWVRQWIHIHTSVWMALGSFSLFLRVRGPRIRGRFSCSWCSRCSLEI